MNPQPADFLNRTARNLLHLNAAWPGLADRETEVCPDAQQMRLACMKASGQHIQTTCRKTHPQMTVIAASGLEIGVTNVEET